MKTTNTFSPAAVQDAIRQAFGDRTDALEIHAELLKIPQIHEYLAALTTVIEFEPQTGYAHVFYETMPDALAAVFLSDDFLAWDGESVPREFQPHGICSGDDIVRWHVRLESDGQGFPLPFANGEACGYELSSCWNYVSPEELQHAEWLKQAREEEDI